MKKNTFKAWKQTAEFFAILAEFFHEQDVKKIKKREKIVVSNFKMPVNPYAKTYGSSRRRRRLLPKISSEDAVAEFNNALDDSHALFIISCKK